MLMYTAYSLRLGGIYDLRGNAHWRAMARKSETNSETGVQLKKKISADKLPDSRTDGRGRWGGRALSSDGPRMTTSPRWRSHNPGT